MGGTWFKRFSVNRDAGRKRGAWDHDGGPFEPCNSQLSALNGRCLAFQREIIHIVCLSLSGTGFM